MDKTLTIVFKESHKTAGGMVSGSLTVLEGNASGGFLAELNDVHPDFAAHVVAAVNTYSGIQKILAMQGPDGELGRALKKALAEAMAR